MVKIAFFTMIVLKHKIISWVAGILGLFALITGVAALLVTASQIDNGVGELVWVQLIGPALQTVFAVLTIMGGLLMHKNCSAGKRLLLAVLSMLLGLVVIDAVFYFRESQDCMYILSALMLQAVPLVVLLFAIKTVSVEK